MIETMLTRYSIKNDNDYRQALREIMQEIALAGLYRGNFFKKAAFYGGTALRIFYKLDRFSEDLDFSLLKSDPDFSLTPYFNAIEKEFRALGINISVTSKVKKTKTKTAIESAFLKSTSSIHILELQGTDLQQWKISKPLKIKFEVDTDPPQGFSTEEKLLLHPFSFYVKCYQTSDLFAGKLHALLYRSWKNRVKGRDWYDFEWYIRKGYPVNPHHFLERAHQSGELLDKKSLVLDELQGLLVERIKTINFKQAKDDVLPFIKNNQVLELWSQEYFKDLVMQLAASD